MDSEEVTEITREARRYGIKCSAERIGTSGGDEFEYTVNFGKGLGFKNSHAAAKFIDALVLEHKLKEASGGYRVAFGWEI